MRRSTILPALSLVAGLTSAALPNVARGDGGGDAGTDGGTGITCVDDGICQPLSEDCTCTDCAGLALCVPDQCVDDGVCDLKDACSCVDCLEDAYCNDKSHCEDDGACDAFEGCRCADCASKATCPPDATGAGGSAGTGGSGGASAGGAGGSGTGGSSEEPGGCALGAVTGQQRDANRGGAAALALGALALVVSRLRRRR